jgi:hypothetical protein
MGITEGVIGGVLGMLGGDRRENRQKANNKELMGVQFENQKKLNEQGQSLQQKTWNDTNYPAQMEMMKKAGLNPALMYGMGGGGGTTTGSQGGGSATGGAVSQSNMDISGAMTASTIELQKSQAEKNRVETEKIAGVDTQKVGGEIDKIGGEIEKIKSDIEKNAQEVLKGKSTIEVNETVKKLNESLTKLNSQKVLESINQVNLTGKDIQWMDRTGLNRNDSETAKTIKYYAERTGLTEDAVIKIMGGLEVMKGLTGAIRAFK